MMKLTLRSDSNKNFKIPRPKLNMFKNSLALIRIVLQKK